MKIVVCYPHVNAYMAACWRELAKREVDLFVLGFKPGAGGYPIAFAEEIMQGLNHRLLDDAEIKDDALVASLVAQQKPDVLMVSGWAHRAYRRLSAPRTIMLMDNQLKGTWKQFLGKFALRKYLGRMDFLFVTGERAWQLAKYWNICESKIRRGCCGIDYEMLSTIYSGRSWPRGFLYVGRYQAVKGADLLLGGYSQYRKLVSDPWPLRCAGMGELEAMVSATAGVENLGFVQPARVAELYGQHAALVLFGRYDAWPLALVEACAAGLPVICSEACGSSVEMIRPYYNGLTIPTGDVNALAHGMKWLHEHADQIPQMGARGHELAAAYSAQSWADRVQAMLACM